MSQYHILFIFAHPDDETFACGGTLSRYADDPNVQTTLYCATPGDAGSPGTPPLCTQEELGQYRTKELASAADVLGIDRLILRDFHDRSLEHLPKEILMEDIKKTIEDLRPDAVITFPPHGISGHPDHQAVQLATLKALQQCDPDQRIRLYYVVIPQSENQENSSVYTTPDEAITTRINVTPYRKRIMKALQQHRTQHKSVEKVFPGVLNGNWESLRTWEFFQAVRPLTGIPSDRLL